MLRFADGGYYPTTGTPTPPSFITQIQSMYDVTGGTITSTTGRFTGTTAFRTTSTGAVGKFFTMTGTMFRCAVDVSMTSIAAEQTILVLADRVITPNATLATAINQTGVFFGITRNTAGKIVLRKAAATLATSVNSYSSTTGYYRIQVEANLLVAGACKVYVNGELAIDYSGDVVGTATAAERILYGGGQATVGISHMIIWDDDTSSATAFSGVLPDFRIGRLLPTGPGSVTQGTPVGAATNWEAVDEPFRNGATDYVQFTANGQKDLYTFEDLPANVTSVLSIIAQPSAFNAGTRPARIRAEVKSGATTAFKEDTNALQLGAVDSGAKPSTLEFSINPDTGVSWTPAEVNAAEFGVSAVFL